MKLYPDHQLTPEQEVLLWAIRVDHTKDKWVGGLLAAGLVWDYLRETAIQHRVIPLLYKRLKGEMSDLVPPNELNTLRTLFIANTTSNIRMTQHLLKVIDLLAGSGIDAMPFKGPVLAVQAYGDLSMRSFGDLDLLTHARDLDRIYQILTDQGYIPTRPDRNSLEEQLRFFQQKDLSFFYQHNFIEVHWKIIERLYAVLLDMDQVWDRSLPVSILGREIKTLSPEDMVLVLCFHGFKHGWQKLNWLADLIYIISNHPDLQWHEVIVHAENWGVKRIVLIGLFLAHKHGGIRYGSEIENLIMLDPTVLKLASKIQRNIFQFQTLEPPFINPFLYLKSRERFEDKIMYVFYFFTDKVLVFLKWILRQITRIKTSPGNGVG